MSNISTIDWYNKEALKFHNKNKDHDFSKMYVRFTKDIVPNGKVLDVGCGPARDLSYFHKKGFEVYGVDASDGIIELAKQILPDCKYSVADVLKLPFENNYFNGIWCMATLLHLESISEISKALSEMFRVLKTNGIIHIVTGEVFGNIRSFETTETPSRHFINLTKEELEKLCNDAGFSMLNSESLTEDKMYDNGRPNIHWLYYLGRK